MFNIGSYPPCSRHYLFGKVWIRSSFLQINAFSQGCAEVGEVKGGQRSVMGVWAWPTKAVALHQPGPSRDVFDSPQASNNQRWSQRVNWRTMCCVITCGSMLPEYLFVFWL